MRILNSIIEIIFSPLAFIFKSNLISKDYNKYAKPIFVFLASIIILAALILYYYRKIIFG